jgi:hypothetical protein
MTNESQFPEETWTELLNLIELKKVVPIAGRALSLVDAGDGSRVPVLDAVLDRLAKQLSIAPRDPPWTLSELFVESARNTRYSADSFHLMLRKELDSAQTVLGPLKQLAEITDFRLLLSTGIDGFLERAVSEVRGATGEPVRTIAFAPDGCYDLPGRLEDVDGVTVFKLLGGRETFPNWAVTVENALEFVIALHGEKYRPVNLLDAIKDRHVLAIGCQIPDWLGRFFLRCLRGGPISAQRSTNFLVENAKDADKAFGEYLRQFSKSSFIVPSDAAGFVDELNRRWKARQTTSTGTQQPVAQSRPAQSDAPHKVFLSYSHDDRGEAEQLYRFLATRRVDIWKDNEGGIPRGAAWDAEIRRRIADCACFVPLVTRNTARESDSYFWAEWNGAIDRTRRQDPRRRFIFPVMSENGLAIPEVFSAMQATLSDANDMDRLADSLRKEQQRLRKEQRASA